MKKFVVNSFLFTSACCFGYIVGRYPYILPWPFKKIEQQYYEDDFPWLFKKTEQETKIICPRCLPSSQQ